MDDESMSGENLDVGTEPAASAAPEASPPGEAKRSGPGLLLGFVLGALAGALVTILLAPPTRDEGGSDHGEPGGASEGQGASAEGVEGIVAGLRARLREASVEARQAAQQAEQAKRARFEQLTRD